jgi:arginyl-tRNA synthetase
MNHAEHDPNALRHSITQAIADALVACAILPDGTSGPDFVVDYPTDKCAGAHYFSNVALVVAKLAQQSPRAIAEQLAENVQTQNLTLVESVAVAGPGFLNFTLMREYFTAQLLAPEPLADTLADQTIILEYTSPNLFKPLHVGNLVGNIVGESLARLYESAGATVVRSNYPSDIGLTVAKGVWGLQQSAENPGDIEALGAAYRAGHAAYEAGGEEKEQIIAVNKALYAESDPALTELRLAGLQTSKHHLDQLLQTLGTKFDQEITESTAAELGVSVVRENITNCVFEESEGAVVYRGEKVGLHTRVFLNSAGLPTYEAKDIGHYSLKHATHPDWTRSIIVTGREQTEYFKVIYAALRELYPNIADRELIHVPTGYLTLTTGKMSSRLGNVLTGESILQTLTEEAARRAAIDDPCLHRDIAVAALKYEILRHGVGSDMVFDPERALSFEGDSGPYLQYTHARLRSVIEKAEDMNIESATDAMLSDDTQPPAPYSAELLIERFAHVVAEAVASSAPQQLMVHLTELAGAFNTFYATEKIADPNDQYAPYKLLLATRVADQLQDGLKLLGIPAPERM